MRKALHSLFSHHRWNWIQNLESDLHELRYLFWESTRRCNLACRHCGSDCGRDDDQPGLPRATVETVFRRIAGSWDASGVMLVVTGGEPLVRRDLLPILETARGLGFRLGIVTNGYALNARRARELAAVGLEAIVVSLDGPREDHDWLRAREGSFERAATAIRELRAAGVPVVEAITCVVPRTLPRLEATYEIVRDLGATHWRVFNVFPAGRATDNRDVLLDEEGIRALVHAMARLRPRGQAEGVEVNLSEEGWLGWDWEGKVRDATYFCRAGINIAGLMADGAIAACPNLAPWMHQGNVADDDFVEVWEQRYQLFRDRTWTREGECGDCDQWRVCRGNSLHLWDPEKKRPHWCHYRILHPADG
jgi:radical SAM protein with 4Fe4S-binding SPASM domain